MKDIIDYLDFEKIDIRVGTIIKAEENNSLKKPSIVLIIDFGDKIGIKNRDLVAKILSKTQLKKAEELALECKKKKYKGCY